jgi:hypothetical protein
MFQAGFTSLKRISECNSVEFESILELLSRGFVVRFSTQKLSYFGFIRILFYPRALQEMFSYLFNELQANGLEYSQNFGVRDPPLMLKQQAKVCLPQLLNCLFSFDFSFCCLLVCVLDLHIFISS